MPTCGNCKSEGQTIEHIRGCYASKGTTVSVIEHPEDTLSGFVTNYVESRDYVPMALAGSVPDSYYALDTPAGLHFYRVKTGKGKWAGFQFVDRLIGHPGDFLRTPVRGANRKAVLNLIGQDAEGAAVLFSRKFQVCAVCQSPLTDPLSLERGLGPICAERF